MPYPSELTEDSLRRIAEAGSDMTQPMWVQIAVAAPDHAAAQAIAAAATRRGYQVELFSDADADEEEDADEDAEHAALGSDESDLETGESEDAQDLGAPSAADDGADESADEDADEDEDTSATWTCICRRLFVASHATITAAIDELDTLAEPHGGYTDGWGSFGNRELKS